MVIVGCSLNEAYGIPRRKKDKKKRDSDNINPIGYDTHEFSPISELGKVQNKEDLPKYLFIPPEDKEEIEIKEDLKEIKDIKEIKEIKEVEKGEKIIETIDEKPLPQKITNKHDIIQPYNIDYNDYLNYMIYKRNINEGFSNMNNNNNHNIQRVNDGFNDVLIFSLFGIFFLIFTDYIYKLGKKSY